MNPIVEREKAMRGIANLARKLGLLSLAALGLCASPAAAADGDLNTAFNGTGKLSGDFGGSSTAEIYGATVQSDGKLVVVGVLDGNGVIARLNLNGSFDMSFGGGDGITPVDSGADDGGERLRAVAVQPDGKIVTVGDATDTAASPFVLARVDSSGVLDGTFDGPGTPGDGVFRISHGAGTGAVGTAIAVSGTKVIFGGYVDFHSWIYRLNDDGTLDTAGFNSPNGRMTFDFPCPGGFCGSQSSLQGLGVQPSDGKIVAVGKANQLGEGIGVARITTAGVLDTASFNSPTGMVTLAPPSGYIGGIGNAVTFDPGGGILVGGSLSGSSPFPTDAAIAALTPTGSLDTAGFGGGTGYAIVPDLGSSDSAYGIARQPDGKLLIGGKSGNGGSLDFMAARFSSSGVLDTGFASPAGYRTTDITSEVNSGGNAFALSSAGIAYVGGGLGTSFPTDTFGIASITAYSVPVPPVLTGTDPVSPANNNHPKIIGTAETGSTVDLWANGTCMGTPALEDQPAADFLSPGLTVSVGDNSTTTFSAKATNFAGTSTCSTTNVTYTEVSPPPPPVLTGTTPASPANDNNPEVFGTAEAGSTVSLYDNGTCTLPAAFTGPVALFTSPGFTVTVPENSTTTFSATATGPGGTSTCSTMNVTYTEVTPPPPPPPPTGGGNTPTTTPAPQATGQRAAALKKCKKKRGRARRNCIKRANKLPV